MPYKAESAGCVADKERGNMDTMLLREPLDAPAYVDGTGPEGGETSFIASM